MEIKQYAGKCKCGKELEIRIVDKEDKVFTFKKDNIPQFWIIYGFCKKCNMIYMQGVFVQDEKPVEDRDFMIDWDRCIKEEESIKEGKIKK